MPGSVAPVQCLSIISKNWLNRKDVSQGPPQASGWNCTENAGMFLYRMPSQVLSLTLMKYSSAIALSMLEDMTA